LTAYQIRIGKLVRQGKVDIGRRQQAELDAGVAEALASNMLLLQNSFRFVGGQAATVDQNAAYLIAGQTRLRHLLQVGYVLQLIQSSIHDVSPVSVSESLQFFPISWMDQAGAGPPR